MQLCKKIFVFSYKDIQIQYSVSDHIRFTAKNNKLYISTMCEAGMKPSLYIKPVVLDFWAIPQPLLNNSWTEKNDEKWITYLFLVGLCCFPAAAFVVVVVDLFDFFFFFFFTFFFWGGGGGAKIMSCNRCAKCWNTVWNIRYTCQLCSLNLIVKKVQWSTLKPSHRFWVSAVGISLRNLIENQTAFLQYATLTWYY